jgi:hypothetical protein
MRVRLPKVTRNEALGCDMPALSIVPTGSSIDFLMTPAAERELHVARLGEEIATLAARLHSATYERLVLLREFDACDGWNNGFLSCAHWLHWRTGIDLGAAREKVRVARALAAHPCISTTMQRGALSYAKVRALTRIATPDNERQLVDLALAGTAAQSSASSGHGGVSIASRPQKRHSGGMRPGP